MIIFNPIIESQNNRKWTQVFSWNDPDMLISQYIEDVKQASWGIVQYKIVEKTEVGEYPDLPGKKKQVNANEWGNGDMRQHHLWWFKHIPRAVGSSDGKFNNWWQYIMTYDEYNFLFSQQTDEF